MGEWILCSNRLPTEEECRINNSEFLITDGKIYMVDLFDVYADELYEPQWAYSCINPIAWMNIPEFKK